MSAFFLGIVVSIVIYLGVGWYAGRKVKHLDDYYIAGRNAPTLLIIGTLVASFLSTNAFIGEAGMSYSGHGPLIVIMTTLNATGYIVGALFFGRYLRRSRALTVPEFFYARYQSHRLQAFAGLTIVFGLSCYLLAVTWGVSLIISQVTGLSGAKTIFIAWFGYTLFTLYSGSRGVILTDTLMFLLFTAVALLALFFVIDASGGWRASVEQLAVFEAKPDLISWHGVSGPDYSWKTPSEALAWALILGFAWGMVVAVSPWQSSRYLMARSEHVVIRSACGAALAMFVLYLVITFGATSVNLSKADIEPVDSVMIWAAMNLMPTLAGVLLVTGIMAAGLSSASTFLSLIGFSVSNDLLRHSSDPDQLLKTTRRTMVAVGLLVLIFAQILPSNIFWITYFAGPMFASAWGPVAFMSIWSARITEAGAFWGMVAGFASNLATNALSLIGGVEFPVYLDPILVGAAVSLLTIITVSRGGEVSEQEHDYRQELHKVPGSELEPSELGRTLAWTRALMVAGLIVMIILTLFYARPYLSATAQRTTIAAGFDP